VRIPGQVALRNDVAHPFRDDLAQRTEMMSPGIPG